MNFLTRFGADEERFKEASAYPSLRLARIISQYNALYKIITEEGERLAEISGRLRYETEGLEKYPAVGDFVMVDFEEGAGNAVIHKILRRKSAFERTAAGTEHQTQVVAANIDFVFICMALNSDYNLSRLERYLSIAWSSGAVPVAVLTKADLCENLSGVLAEVSKAAPATDIIISSKDDGDACERLESYLKPGVTASFIGSSGVGKSTLINRLSGSELMITSELGKNDKGRHITTRRELLVLPKGGIVIDTPGMREIGAESVDLARSFSDIDALALCCRFRDCTHTTEPDCAVRRAIEDGTLDERRLESYRKLKREAVYDGLSSKEIETEKFNAMFKEIGGMKNIRKFNRQSKKRKGE